MRIKLLLIIFGLANSFFGGTFFSLSGDMVVHSPMGENLANINPCCKIELNSFFGPAFLGPVKAIPERGRNIVATKKNVQNFESLELRNIKDSTFQLLQSIPINSTYLITDNLQNIYVATQKGQVVKFDKKGKLQFEYNNNRLGEIGKIDVRNPLTILVYYPDLAVVVILDRTLSLIRELNLYDLDIIEPTAIALANDNNIWVYDEVAAMLKKISQTGKILFESRNLNQLTRKKLRPKFLLEKNNLLYLSDLENGLFIFDSFGQLKQEVPVKGIERFQIVGKQLFFKDEGQCFQLFLDTLEKEIVGLPKVDMNVENVLISGQLIYLMGKKAIKIYQHSY